MILSLHTEITFKHSSHDFLLTLEWSYERTSDSFELSSLGEKTESTKWSSLMISLVIQSSRLNENPCIENN